MGNIVKRHGSQRLVSSEPLSHLSRKGDWMKKRYIFSAAGVAGAVGATLAGRYFKNKSNQSSITTFEDAGIPDQTTNMDLAQFENAKMVSEGSQFGVNYYNEMKEEMEAQQEQ